jgi:hypothetical protein
MYWIKDFDYLEDYKLRLVFGNRKIKVVDLEKYLVGKVFKPLKKLSYFRKVRLNTDIDTVVWPNNADFSPDFLYEIGK